MELLSNIGIPLIHRIILSFQAKSPEDAEKGLLFMQEMLELSKSQTVSQLTELQVCVLNITDEISRHVRIE